MALIACPECTRSVSDQAMTCPHCGFGLNPYSAPRAPVPRVPIITTQQTAKPWKAAQLAGFAIAVLGVVLVAFDRAGAGLALIGAGFVVAIAGALFAWWHHA